MTIVPKGGRANVRHIDTAKTRTQYAGGRATSVGYDPATGEEHEAKYKDRTRDSAMETDVFALVESTGYSEERFYCRSVNADGHGEKLQIRVPQGLDSQLHAAVAEVPEYKTLHDLFRDAVVHRLEYIQKRYNLGDGARRVLELERISSEMARYDAEIDAMITAVQEIDTRCKRAWDTKDYGILAEQMDKASETVDWLREPYRGLATTALAEWRRISKAEVERHRAQQEE